MPRRRTTDEDQGVDISFNSLDVLFSFYFLEIAKYVCSLSVKSIWFYRFCAMLAIVGVVAPIVWFLCTWGTILYDEHQSSKPVVIVHRRVGEDE